MTESSQALRTRQFLFDTSDCEVRAKLRGKLPQTAVPTAQTIAAPSALMTAIREQYDTSKASSILGIIVEHLLRPAAGAEAGTIAGINMDRVLTRCPTFVKAITATRDKLQAIYTGTEPKYDVELTVGKLTGHPDIVAGSHIFEVKWTTQLKQNFTNFLLQLFCYAAMDQKATHVHLVLPAQTTIMSWDLSEWSKRALFRQTMITLAEQVHAKFTRPNHFMQFQIVAATVGIGHHIGRKNPRQTLCQLVLEQHNPYPTQLFLSGNNNTSTLHLSDMDIAKMNDHITRNSQSIYVHAPYQINLCATPGTQDNYFTKALSYNLEVSAAIGFRGVVVHTGKLSRPGYSLEHMEANIWTVLANATVECPLLIETPAREGTEQLNDPEQLAEFVMRFHKDCPLGTKQEMQQKVGICVDTCHVFAAGHQPMDYIQTLAKTFKEAGGAGEGASLIKLIHFNDSLFPFNSNRDRHATPGTGEISWSQLSTVVVYAVIHKIHMVVE